MVKIDSRKTKDFNPDSCPVKYCMNFIGGKWKPVIIHLIRKECNRYSMLLRAIPDISKQTLANQLRELEKDRVIDRIIYPVIPPKVEYRISSFGASLLPVIDIMEEWGLKHMQEKKFLKKSKKERRKTEV